MMRNNYSKMSHPDKTLNIPDASPTSPLSNDELVDVALKPTYVDQYICTSLSRIIIGITSIYYVKPTLIFHQQALNCADTNAIMCKGYSFLYRCFAGLCEMLFYGTTGALLNHHFAVVY